MKALAPRAGYSFRTYKQSPRKSTPFLGAMLENEFLKLVSIRGSLTIRLSRNEGRDKLATPENPLCVLLRLDRWPNLKVRRELGDRAIIGDRDAGAVKRLQRFEVDL